MTRLILTKDLRIAPRAKAGLGATRAAYGASRGTRSPRASGGQNARRHGVAAQPVYEAVGLGERIPEERGLTALLIGRASSAAPLDRTSARCSICASRYGGSRATPQARPRTWTRALLLATTLDRLGRGEEALDEADRALALANARARPEWWASRYVRSLWWPAAIRPSTSCSTRLRISVPRRCVSGTRPDRPRRSVSSCGAPRGLPRAVPHRPRYRRRRRGRASGSARSRGAKRQWRPRLETASRRRAHPE